MAGLKDLCRPVLYGLPILGQVMLVAPIMLLGGIYSRYYGISLTTIAGIMFASRLFDAISDPLIGLWSDRIRRSTGSRKLLIFMGGCLFAFSSFLLYAPPVEQIGTTYITVLFFIFYLGVTMLLIPYLAWPGDMFSAERDRSLLFSAFMIATQIGALLFYLVPFLPLFETQDITPEVLRVSAIIGIGLMLPCLCLVVIYLPNGRTFWGDYTINQLPEKNNVSLMHSVRSFAIALWGNRPFVIFIGAFMCSGVASGAWISLFFILVDGYLGQGGMFAKISLIGTLVSIPSVYLGRKFMLQFSARAAWLLSIVFLMLSFFLTGFLEPGLSEYWLLSIIYSANMIGISCQSLAAFTMLSSISDYGTLRSGQDTRGSYFSIFTFLTKTQMAFGAAFGLSLAGWFGYDATIIGGQRSMEEVVGLKLGAAWLPCLFSVAAFLLVSQIPLDSRKVEIVRRALDRRISRQPIQERETLSKI